MKIRIFLATLATLALTGCFDRELADSRMVKGCVAGVKALVELPEGTELTGPNNVKTGATSLGREYRQVDLTLSHDDGWYAEEKPYQCTFHETIGLLGSHKAVIHHLKIGDREYGMRDNKIIGSMQDHLLLINAVEDAM